MRRPRNRRRIGGALAGACVLALALAPSEASARRGPGGEFGVGLVVGLPTALELVYMPWESSFSIEAKFGLAGFKSQSYGELGFTLHTPELLRRPIYSARLAVGGGVFTMTEELPGDTDTAGEFGGIGSVSLLIELSAMPMQVVFTTSVRRAFIERNDRVADDFNIGATGGFRYFF